MEDDKNEKKKIDKGTAIRLIILGVALALSLVVSVLISHLRESEIYSHVDDGGEEEVDVTSSFTQFENEYQLEYGVGKTTAKKIFSQIDKIVSAPEEHESINGGLFTATLIETSFRRASVDYGYAYSFDLEVLDGRKYQVYAVVDTMYGNGYYGCLVRRMEPVADLAYLELSLVSEDTEYLKRTDAIEMLSSWAKSKMPNVEIVLNVSDL